MATTTPARGYPYPTPTDPPRVQSEGLAPLALAVDRDIAAEVRARQQEDASLRQEILDRTTVPDVFVAEGAHLNVGAPTAIASDGIYIDGLLFAAPSGAVEVSFDVELLAYQAEIGG